MVTLRKYIVAGLLVWVPLGVTVLIIKFLVELMDKSLLWIPEAYRPEQLMGFRIPGLGLVLVLFVVLLTGVIVANFFGRKLVQLGEKILNRIPLVRSIYYGVKQVMETMFSGTGKSFRKVVVIEYPRKGIWTLAFLTGDSITSVSDMTGKKMINVFVPTTPNPTSGFFLMLPEEDVMDLNINVDDGLKMIISAGVVVPKRKAEVLKK
ncbi:MAG TPA: DUF502 domain-containing protein [Acidiferrobacteraceae bacterium]|nr:DUF502 domain-containing protein [Acidiferrobacteraceae bacterium]HEX20140.1 DUF502 domain-containing protein [Acidiferrobacteraceae bacterium]